MKLGKRNWTEQDMDSNEEVIKACPELLWSLVFVVFIIPIVIPVITIVAFVSVAVVVAVVVVVLEVVDVESMSPIFRKLHRKMLRYLYG